MSWLFPDALNFNMWHRIPLGLLIIQLATMFFFFGGGGGSSATRSNSIIVFNQSSAACVCFYVCREWLHTILRHFIKIKCNLSKFDLISLPEKPKKKKTKWKPRPSCRQAAHNPDPTPETPYTPHPTLHISTVRTPIKPAVVPVIFLAAGQHARNSQRRRLD